MDGLHQLREFLSVLRRSVEAARFVKLTLGSYTGEEAQLQALYVRSIVVKKEAKLSFTFHYQTRDIVKNYSLDESFAVIEKQLREEFAAATLFTLDNDLQLSRKGSDGFALHKHKPSHKAAPTSEHNRAKQRLIAAGNDKPYLHALGVTNANGEVLAGAQDKYRQINKYVEILSGLVKHLPPGRIQKVADMGCGKGYLTFALYDYLTRTLKLDVEVTGVEARPELVTLCNAIAAQSGFEGLRFVQSTIDFYNSKDTNILIALHACDTATDDAICKGIEAGAELIVVAPCCHKQVRREMEKGAAQNALGFLIKHGIFMDRQAEMVTDGMRALILEYFGYGAKVFEFISDAHTPKNVMIVGSRNPALPVKNAASLKKIQETKAYFGIGEHYLERALGII